MKRRQSLGCSLGKYAFAADLLAFLHSRPGNNFAGVRLGRAPADAATCVIVDE